jgi:hypothetical protein
MSNLYLAGQDYNALVYHLSYFLTMFIRASWSSTFIPSRAGNAAKIEPSSLAIVELVVIRVPADLGHRLVRLGEGIPNQRQV